MNSNLMQAVIQLERSQSSEAVEILAQAFQQDPIMQYFYPVEEQSRLSSLRWLSRLMLNYSRSHHEIYASSPAIRGCAIWLPPAAYPMNTIKLLQLGFYQFPLKVQWRRIGDFWSIFNMMELYHHQDMPKPHWYLLMLGVAPNYQGQGTGSSLIQPVLTKADQQGLPCYLETSTEKGVNFYQKHGFAVLRSGHLSPSALRFWTMKREPQSSF